MCSVFCFLIFHSFEFFKYFCIKLTGLVITCKWTLSPVNTNYGSVNETYNRLAQTTWEPCSQMFYANHMEIYQRDINCPRNESEITPHTHSISASLSVSGTKHHTDTPPTPTPTHPPTHQMKQLSHAKFPIVTKQTLLGYIHTVCMTAFKVHWRQNVMLIEC